MAYNLDTLNPVQREAVCATEGPLLILAGAGSGKTRVLTHRIAYMIDENMVNPWNILAITFTNKAAQEMKERVEKLVEYGAESIWVATFHSTCVRILRRYIDLIGFDNNFTIYDTDDQKQVVRRIIKQFELDSKVYKEYSVLAAISSAKNDMLTADDIEKEAGGNYRQRQIAKIYAEYQKILKSNNALDFDDLLIFTVKLLKENPDVLNYYQERFKYILVDEYQDTNTVQFELIRLLAGKYHNLCVVGDDDQSIYKFRGANITNILSFENVYEDTKVIKLEQNYRSTMNILNAANDVISHNISRKDKKLWSSKGTGEPVIFEYFDSGFAEADGIVREIKKACENGLKSYNDFAILYRTNAQSRLFEEKCMANSVPYRLIGGINFYQRQEIKDILCYLKVIDSGRDDLSVLRIVNTPKRGIGTATLNKLSIYAQDNGLKLFQAMEIAGEIPGIGKAADKIKMFVNQIMVLRARAKEESPAELINTIIEVTGYDSELEKLEEDKEEQKKENIDELVNKAADFYEKNENASLSEFLEDVALVADIDSYDREADCITLMTLHGAKGLEFPDVYISGMEDGLFPSYRAISSGDISDIEEERRLCYVGITRAMEKLVLTAARQRMSQGTSQFNKKSRFISEIEPEDIEIRDNEIISSSYFDKSRKIENIHEEIRKTYGKGFSGFSANNAAKPAADFGKLFKIEKPSSLPYGPGDRVRHVKFGEGTVKEIVDIKKDFQVTVAFDDCGIKKMFAGFAKLVKVD